MGPHTCAARLPLGAAGWMQQSSGEVLSNACSKERVGLLQAGAGLHLIHSEFVWAKVSAPLAAWCESSPLGLKWSWTCQHAKAFSLPLGGLNPRNGASASPLANVGARQAATSCLCAAQA